MTITGKGVAVALAVIIALAALFFGPAIFMPFQSAQTTNPATMSANDNSEATTSLPTSLQVSDISEGTGAIAAAGDTVTVEYVGALPDGTVFDASKNHGDGTFTFVLGAGKVIPGWDQGLVGMKEGGVRGLVIPPDMAYGAQAVGSIPANSTLIFQVKLDNVQKGAAQ
jgi:FKBP-type peptidyl-prolyl cis-trans isomerase